jgi:glycosyltransferase involved in cell wall biosynthesis
MKIVRKLLRVVDFCFATIFGISFLIALSVRKIFGKIQIKNPKNCLISLSKDGIYRILQYNGNDYFDWDFTRPHAEKTYVMYIGPEKHKIFKLGKKVIGINCIMPLDKIRTFAPFTITVIQQFIALIMMIKLIKKISPKAIEVMFPSKLALRAVLLKWILSIKVVTQVRGNIDLIYYFIPFPVFWPFKIPFQPFETLQVMWDKFISLIFYRTCDLVIGYNINNMLSAISNGAHPKKTKLSRIKIELNMLDSPKIPRNQLDGIPLDGKILSIWSRLSPEKLVLEAIQAFEILLQKTEETLYLIIIGDGPEKQKIASYIKTSPYKNYILLLGKKERTFIAQISLHSSLVIVPYGGSSLVEAVMLNTPVVAFDIEWHNELIRDGETGYLADFPDINHLAHKMLQSLSDPQKSKKMAENAIHLAQKMFDNKTIDEKEARYYKLLFE